MYVSDFSILLSPMVCAHSFLLKKLLEKGDLTWGREAYHPVGIALCQISAWARLCHVDAEGAAGVRRPRPGSAVSLSRRAGVRDEPVASAETSARRWQGSGRTPGQRRVRGYSGAAGAAGWLPASLRGSPAGLFRLACSRRRLPSASGQPGGPRAARTRPRLQSVTAPAAG